MAASANERKILTTRPESRAILLQLRNVIKIGLAAGLVMPQAQAFMAGMLNSVQIPGVSQEMKALAPYLPSAMLILHVAYWFLYQKTCEFVLTDERLIVRYGVLLRVEDEVELYRVVDVTQTIGLLQRLLGVGNIQVASTDRTGIVVLPLIKSPSAVRNSIRSEAERCKGRRGAVRILE